jgi:hypothetical protein
MFVIYTGYEENELSKRTLKELKKYGNVMLKIGRYDANKDPYYNDQLGITLASNNQYVVVL